MTDRPVPLPDDLTAPFWDAANRGELQLQRCVNCATYCFPPAPACRTCAAADMVWTRVSGAGTVHSYSQVWSGARHPAFAERTPYLVGFVEINEQPGLLMHSNFPGAVMADLRAGAPVEVVFDQLAPGRSIPQFRLSKAAAAELQSTAGELTA